MIFYTENVLMHKNQNLQKIILPILILINLIPAFFTSCSTLPSGHYIYISRRFDEPGVLTATQLARFFKKNNKHVNYYKIKKFAQLYIDEAAMEKINSDVAFAQMCLETGYLTFGNLVTPDMHNYCGLGSTGKDNPGERFATPQLGVRAHIQHLQAYATTEDKPLNNELVDPRYNWVHKTKYIETIDQLAGTWAMDPDYGIKLERILTRMEDMVN